MAKKKTYTDRELMEMAIAEMHKSIQEPRDDKVSPKVGAILVKADGTIDKAHRGEIRHGDHAEFTLLEKKNRFEALDGGVVYATLEPCAPGARKHPKLSCAERLVNARIKTVWVGIEDPDPTVDRKGIEYLQDHGVEVRMFDRDLQVVIRDTNDKFIEQAEERAKNPEPVRSDSLSSLENILPDTTLQDLSPAEQITFIRRANIPYNFNSPEFERILHRLGMVAKEDEAYKATGLGLLLFGSSPQYEFPQAVIRATFKRKGQKDILETIDGPLVTHPEKAEKWYRLHLNSGTSRAQSQREELYSFPTEILREAIVNAILHRDYSIEGAPIYLEINDEAVVIKSPGLPVLPITLDQIKSFNVPSLSRNPKMMYVFDQLGLAEQRGLGFSSFKDIPEDYSLPRPIITFEDPYLVFTFPRVEGVVPGTTSTVPVTQGSDTSKLGSPVVPGTPVPDTIRSFITKGSFTRKEFQEDNSLEKKTAEREIKKMIEAGLIVRKGSGPSTYYEIIAT